MQVHIPRLSATVMKERCNSVVDEAVRAGQSENLALRGALALRRRKRTAGQHSRRRGQSEEGASLLFQFGGARNLALIPGPSFT